ncbi:hypothetical protein TRICI_001816 [Trichomonascus ciferrii]|uniref:Inclusion body clearance protein IML2 n=1 Tax=Trichomonascus ciferrii TaxID=44093 RepID=A0A642V864_9ASCO|nr:hypothetical protein TRICI_001816 [Trichomonascus ciferrii]
MLKALGFGKQSPSPSAGGHGEDERLSVLKEAVELEVSLRAMDLVMDDRPSEANKSLKEGKSTYNKLALGVINFIEATLGFEPEAIKLAVDSLYEAEQSSHRDRQKSQRTHLSTSSKFPPGTEYAVTMAEAHLLGAISLFLSESVIDSAKAFYKLRKAYQILDEVNGHVNSKGPGQNSNLSTASSSGKLSETTSRRSVASDEQLEQKARDLKFARSQRINRATNPSSETLIDESDGIEMAHESVDEFIQSGVDAMFGLLQLVISIIPPTLGRVLSLVGFRGDKEHGLKLLWRASGYSNVHGAIALLALLQFYDGPTQFSDIELPQKSPSNSSSGCEDSSSVNTTTSDITSVEDMELTKKKLETGLDRIRKFYPRGALWQLQEGRMVASKGDMPRAVEIMNDTSSGPIEMKQVEGLMLFDKTIMLVVLHEFETAAENFVRLVDLNSWSHAFYYYLSGACHVELYRQHKTSNPEYAAKHKKLATAAIEKAPTLVGKKRFMAKSMPFDMFVLRKTNQWKHTSQSEKVDLVDAIGTSPIHEVIYFWNGFCRMPKELLEKSLTYLAYSTNEQDPPIKETEDEQITRNLLQSVALRFLDRSSEGISLLDNHVLPKIWTPQPHKGHTKSGLPKVQYHKHHKDAYAGPSAIYERGIFEWKLNGLESVDRVKDYMELATAWADDYELSTRVGMKIKSATDRLETIHSS